jgi:hypothetical protein
LMGEPDMNGFKTKLTYYNLLMILCGIIHFYFHTFYFF